ncbi:MAG: tyrosine-type recombinase/integrase [Thermoproteota archaeon]|nr:tyrosine-type recombinase/integrase [Thermoproteota archaeon]
MQTGGEGKVGGYASEGVFGDISSKATLSASSQIPTLRKHVCPDCGSVSFRDGHYKSSLGLIIQRYLCTRRGCGRRFSDINDCKRAKELGRQNLSEPLKSAGAILNSCQIRDEETSRFSVNSFEETKNLVSVKTPMKSSVLQSEKPAEPTVKADINLVIEDYKYYIRKERILNDITLDQYCTRLKWLTNIIGVNLFEPEDFKTKLAFNTDLSQKQNGNKNNIIKAYLSFINDYLHKDVKIKPFEYKSPEHKIPQTQHMEALYFALTLQMKVFCFVQMATAARPIEVLRLEWTDIDFIRKEIRINKPAKHGNTRTAKLIGRFITVLDMLTEWKNRQTNLSVSGNRKQRNTNLIFTYKDTGTAGACFRRARARVAKENGIPEINEITFYSNRHWRAVLERYLKGNSDAVAILLGHNSDKYVKVYAPLSERIYGGDKEWEPIEISEIDPDYSEKMSRYGAEGYQEYNYNRTTGRHYLRKEKGVY